MRFIKWLIPLVLAGALLKPAARLSQRLRKIKLLHQVPTQRVQPDLFVVGLSAEHPLEGCNDTFMMVQGVSGKLAYICEDGVRVKPGDVIARLDAKELERRVDEARLAYANAQARVAQQERTSKSQVEEAGHAVQQAQRELEVLLKSNATELEAAQKELEHKRVLEESARLEYERQQRLAAPEVGLVPRQSVEQAERALRAATFAVTTAEKALEFTQKQQKSKAEQKQNEVSNLDYKLRSAEEATRPAAEAARYAVESTKERLERAQKDVEQATLKAPAAGSLVLGIYTDWRTRTSRPFQVGDDVGPGRRLATISDLSCLEVNLRIEESRIARVAPRQEVILTFEAVPGRTYRGTVASISPSALRGEPWQDPNTRAELKYFTVKVPVRNPDARLRPGLKCKGQIVLGRLRDVLAVPLSGVVRRGGHDFVYVQQSNGFSARMVQTGARNEEAVVIKKGLKSGDVVALQDPTAPSEE
jgi:RND family efflux transporter MFP subunit